MLDRDTCLAQWTEECARTRRLVELMPDHRIRLKPHKSMWTFAEQVRHLVNSLAVLQAMADDDAPDTDTIMAREFEGRPSSAADLKQALHDAFLAAHAALSAVSDGTWERPTTAWGATQTLAEWIHGFKEHEIHHRGQMTVYVRMADQTPPFLYAPMELEETLRKAGVRGTSPPPADDQSSD